jgi:hypothetical protein
MRIAILSDIHDNVLKLEAALQRLEGADALLCCGDLCSPFIIDQLGLGFSGPIHIVFGNNDADHYRMTMKLRNYPHITLHGEFADLQLDGKRFALNHYDNLGRAIAASNIYDVVCYGHNHQYEVAREGKSLRINPGAIMGAMFTGGQAKTLPSTFALYDTATDAVTQIVV